jgi:uncharacterized protein YmfQ (DUF2313 family)
MPFTGGSASMPATVGGDDDVVDAILEGLNAAHGTAYDTSESSNVYVENAAYADAIAGIYDTNQRIANQADPQRMTSMLPRWERIMKIAPSDGATMPERRREVARRWGRVGVVTTDQSLFDEVRDVIGDVLVAIEYDIPATATTFWPSGTPNVYAPWYSTISIAKVHVEPTSGMTYDEFCQAVGQAIPVLDARLPAWATWMTWRNDPVTGLPEFILDRDHNLDWSVFDS